MAYTVFTKKGCGTCMSVKAILNARGVEFNEVDVATEEGLRLARKYNIMNAGSILDETGNVIPIEKVGIQ